MNRAILKIGIKVGGRPENTSPYRCGICNGYLRENGTIACTACLGQDFPRVDAVTRSLQKVDLPCRFEEHGCKEKVRFGEIADHEDVCQFKPISCFILPTGTCTWRGQIKHVMKHFVEKHPNSVVKNGELVVDIKRNVPEKMVVFEKSNIITVWYYSLDVGKLEFHYCLRYISHYDLVLTYKFKVCNTSDKDYCSFLRHDKHERFRGSFQMDSTLNLRELREFLGNAKSLIFSLVVDIPINLDELSKLKCKLCGVYVTPPMFKAHDQFVCFFCSEKRTLFVKPFKNPNLESVAQLNYPCRWKYCTAVAKYDKIRHHENACSHREVACPEWNCNETINVENLFHHFETTHGDYRYISEEYYVHISETNNKFFVVQVDQLFVIRFTYISALTLWYQIYPATQANGICPYLKSGCCNHIEKLAPDMEVNLKQVFSCCSNNLPALKENIVFGINPYRKCKTLCKESYF